MSDFPKTEDISTDEFKDMDVELHGKNFEKKKKKHAKGDDILSGAMTNEDRYHRIKEMIKAGKKAGVENPEADIFGHTEELKRRPKVHKKYLKQKFKPENRYEDHTPDYIKKIVSEDDPALLDELKKYLK